MYAGIAGRSIVRHVNRVDMRQYAMPVILRITVHISDG